MEYGKKFSMEWKTFSMEWIWKGRNFAEWNMEKLSSIPFHSMPCRMHLFNNLHGTSNFLFY